MNVDKTKLLFCVINELGACGGFAWFSDKHNFVYSLICWFYGPLDYDFCLSGGDVTPFQKSASGLSDLKNSLASIIQIEGDHEHIVVCRKLVDGLDYSSETMSKSELDLLEDFYSHTQCCLEYYGTVENLYQEMKVNHDLSEAWGFISENGKFLLSVEELIQKLQSGQLWQV